MNRPVDTFLVHTSAESIRQLAAVCRESTSTGSVPLHAARQVVGAASAQMASTFIEQHQRIGWSLEQIAVLLGHIAATREATQPPESLFELVLSGPEVSGIPTRDTSAVMNELFVTAQSEVLLVGYAVYGGRELFRRLAEQVTSCPQLEVWFCLDIARPANDTAPASRIVERFAAEFFSRQWPWVPRPALYYDVRSVALESEARSSLHAKCVIVDQSIALVTSANFTQAAQHRNIEAGVVIHHRPQVEALYGYIKGLAASGILAPVA